MGILILSLLLVAFTLALYNRVNHSPFINYDDNRYVSDNPHVQAGLTWSTVKWALTTFYYANWHPLTWISHALDCQLFHMNPAGHHFTSVLLHAVNVVLLFLLLVWSTRRTGPSFIVAALFALHPINVESVAWIAERKNVLCTTFFLLSLAAYGWYALKPQWERYCVMAALLACGLASKPMLVTAPFALLLLDYWPLQRIQGWTAPPSVLPVRQASAGRLFLEKLPLLVLAGASCVITFLAQRASGAMGTSPFPFRTRLENAIYSYAMYLRKAIWPTDLTVFYPHTGHSLPILRIALAAAFLVAATAMVTKLRSRGYLLTGWLWFLGTLVPVIGVIQVGSQAMADRYAYIPLIGIFVMTVWTAADWAKEKKLRLATQLVPAICVLIALSFATYRQIGYWRSSLDLWTHALAITPPNFVAEVNLGQALTELNRADEAYPLFVRAAQDGPNDPGTRINIGTYLCQHGRQAEAIPQYEMALQFGSEPGLLATTYTNLGSAYSDLGEYAKSRDSFEHAVRLNPDEASAWQGLAFLLQKQGKLEEAVPAFARFAELQPSGQNFFQLARVLAQTNHRAEAIAAYQQAVRLDPSLAMAQRH
ncbi:MAG TPA: tetratricopeptide repeat protein [Candidatus Sulfotelmatobacter sp.]|jgi:Tfp pilus assembly protein PilF|nr:tetratricopeptide repeat protein [Candidatus Sulfotelmatobacter sp.]